MSTHPEGHTFDKHWMWSFWSSHRQIRRTVWYTSRILLLSIVGEPPFRIPAHGLQDFTGVLFGDRRWQSVIHCFQYKNHRKFPYRCQIKRFMKSPSLVPPSPVNRTITFSRTVQADASAVPFASVSWGPRWGEIILQYDGPCCRNEMIASSLYCPSAFLATGQIILSAASALWCKYAKVAGGEIYIHPTQCFSNPTAIASCPIPLEPFADSPLS